MEQTHSKRPIILVGGTGYIGHAILSILSGVENITILSRSSGSMKVNKRNFEITKFDSSSHESWNVLLQNNPTIFYLSSQTNIPIANAHPSDDLKANIIPFVNLLMACEKTKSQPAIVFASTSTIYGSPIKIPVDETHRDNPLTVYDLHKRMAEDYLKYFVSKKVVTGCSLRLSNVFGPGARSQNPGRGILNSMIEKAIRGESITVYGDGNFIRDYTYIDDVACAFIKAAQNIDELNGENFIVGTKRGVKLIDAVQEIARAADEMCGLKTNITHTPLPNNLSPIDTRQFIANSDRFSQKTGWRPAVEFETGIRRMITWLKEEEKSA